MKVPKWLVKGARVRTFEDWTVNDVMPNGWIWMKNKDASVRCLHIMWLGKSFKRVATPAARKGRKRT